MGTLVCLSQLGTERAVSLPTGRVLRKLSKSECTPPAHVLARLPLYWLALSLSSLREGRSAFLLSACPFDRSSSPMALNMNQVTGEPLMRRSDDTADKLRSRLKAFHQQTQPVIDYYERAGKNVNIDAKQDKNVSRFFKRLGGGVRTSRERNNE